MVPPADIPGIPGTAPAAQPATATPPAANRQGGQGGAALAPAAALDLADIRPLDVAGALQILIAEVRAALDALLLGGVGADPSAPAEAPLQAAHVLLETLMAASAEGPPQLEAALATRIDSAVQSGVQRAVEIVSSWRGVGQAAPEATQAAAGLIANALSDEVLHSVWLRPEWALFLPRLERWRRRRRNLRRRLRDPDYPQGQLEDDERR